MPSEVACLIEQRFAESQLIGPKRRLGEIVDEAINEVTVKLMGHSLNDLKAIAFNHSDDPILSNIEQGVRDGLAKAGKDSDASHT